MMRCPSGPSGATTWSARPGIPSRLDTLGRLFASLAGVRTASRSKYRSRARVAMIRYEVAGLNLSPRAPTGGLGRTQATRVRARHWPAGEGAPARRLSPKAGGQAYRVGIAHRV